VLDAPSVICKKYVSAVNDVAEYSYGAVNADVGGNPEFIQLTANGGVSPVIEKLTEPAPMF
jgi:hypothetical protein